MRSPRYVPGRRIALQHKGGIQLILRHRSTASVNPVAFSTVSSVEYYVRMSICVMWVCVCVCVSISSLRLSIRHGSDEFQTLVNRPHVLSRDENRGRTVLSIAAYAVEIQK